MELNEDLMRINNEEEIENVLMYFDKLSVNNKRECAQLINNRILKLEILNEENIQSMPEEQIEKYLDQDDDMFSAQELIRIYTALIDRNKTNAKFYLERSKKYYKIQNYKKALDDVNQSIELDQNNVDAYLWKSGYLLKLNDYTQALKAIDIADSLKSQNPDTYRGYALYYSEINENQLAIEWAEKAYNLAPDDKIMYFDLLTYLTINENYDKVLQLTEKNTISNCDNKTKGRIHFARAIAYMQEFKRKDAYNEISLAVKYHPNSNMIQYTYGMLAYMTSDGNISISCSFSEL